MLRFALFPTLYKIAIGLSVHKNCRFGMLEMLEMLAINYLQALALKQSDISIVISERTFISDTSDVL